MPFAELAARTAVAVSRCNCAHIGYPARHVSDGEWIDEEARRQCIIKQEQINHLIFCKKCVANSCEQHHGHQERDCGTGGHGRAGVGEPGRVRPWRLSVLAAERSVDDSRVVSIEREVAGNRLRYRS